MSIVPDMFEPIIAFRLWDYDSEVGLFTSPVDYTQWKDNRIRARCMFGSYLQLHDAPNENCQCGVYGVTNPSRILAAPGQIEIEHRYRYTSNFLGMSYHWGKVIIGSNGVIRSEYAQLAVILLPDTFQCHLAPSLPFNEWHNLSFEEIKKLVRKRFPYSHPGKGGYNV